MEKLSKELTSNGYTLRSGNAEGADQAFARGVVNNQAQIWLPWRKFNKDFQLLYPDHVYRIDPPDEEAIASVAQFHPAYKQMEEGHPQRFDTFMRYMTRNYRQVRGLNEPDSEFVICWTYDGLDIGGTAQAIRIARHYNIPVYNLFNLSVDEVLNEIAKNKLIS